VTPDTTPEATPPLPERPDRRRVLTGAAWLAGAASVSSLPTPLRAAAESRGTAPLHDVAGRLAFISGGASGIGLGMARAFVAAGMRVVITYSQEDQLAPAMAFFRDHRPQVQALRLDVTDREAWQRVADDVEKHHGPVHLLCNNAGVAQATGLVRATYRDWDQGIAQNLGAVFNGVHTFLPRLIAQDDPAHVVATSSISGLLPVGGAGIYNTAKVAVVGLMESLRAELEGEDIGVSVFCPGLVHPNLPVVDTERLRPPGMDPLEAGQHVLRGVRANELFIVPHIEFRDGLQERFEAILASMSEGEAPQPSRLAAEQTMLHNPLYAQERERRRKTMNPIPGVPR
jgi:NAD(P)-dependent dehydrogenase (short-subunit alcohol dehydrogenase family)